MLLKIAGSLITIISAAMIGYIYSRECSKRPQQLRTLQGLLNMLENEISFMSNVLVSSFERICSGSDDVVTVFFRDTARILREKNGMNASEAWEESIRGNIEQTALNKEDTEILISFGKMLGNSDTEGQIGNIRLALEQLKLQEKKAEEVKAKNAAMYRSLGLLGGIAIVIILL